MSAEKFYSKFGNMSKIGNSPITVPPGTEIVITSDTFTASAKEGSLTLSVPYIIKPVLTGDVLKIEVNKNSKNSSAMHGLYRSLINNAVVGVNKKWEKDLEIVGTGYRVKLQGQDLFIEVGYSHPVIFKKPDEITFIVEGTNKIKICGINKELVGQVAHKIKIIRKPDPYKGKGIRYAGEYIKLKLGKKAKAVGGGK